MLILEIESPTGKQKVELQNRFTLGSSSSNDLQIDDPLLSPRQFSIELKTQGFVLRDFSSRHGTRLNGTNIIEAKIEHGDTITAGSQLRLKILNKELIKDESFLSSRNTQWDFQLQTLPTAAQSEFPILLLGESGCGKEILAKKIHQLSKRAHGPLISINCSALSPSLIESELFGHVKGSYTGAATDRKGAFESARGGTLFLDEIGDLPLSLQPKLLRALENSEIRPVGSDDLKRTDVRIIAATHQNLPGKVLKNEFRSDLFYRLNVIRFQLPPLRQRMEDFETLLYGFAREQKVRLSIEAIETLKDHKWPGNIRELKNIVARLSALFPGEHIKKSQISHVLQIDNSLTDPSPADDDRPRSKIQSIERDMIIQKLLANYGNQRRTAAELGIPKSTLHDRIRNYNINVKSLLEQPAQIRALESSF